MHINPTKEGALLLKRTSLKRIISDQDELKSQKGKNKRLSIDTRLLENNSNLLEQMKSSFKIKQQQQQIIESRTRNTLLIY